MITNIAEGFSLVDPSLLWAAVRTRQQDLVGFAQRLVRTPSLPGQEREVALLVQAEMERLGYDRVWIDEVGNVIGKMTGRPGPALMLNGHLDHVEPGGVEDWPYPPYSAEIHDGALWGRGAADMKGAVAAMVYAGGLIKALGLMPSGDLLVCGAVQEEVGGLGSRHLAQTVPVGRAVIGEASANQLRRGHRGRIELVAHFEGRSAHASMPHLSVNPHYSLARFVSGLPSLPMATDAVYGSSTVAPTRVSSEPASANVTPSRLRLILDWRNVPGESTKQVVAKLQALLDRSLEPGCCGRIEVSSKELVSYTGVSMCYPDEFPSFTTEVDHPFLCQAVEALSAVLGRKIPVGTWRFATDGGHLAAAGAAVLGFGPGDDAVVHTVNEHLPLEQLVESVVAYVLLACIG